MAQPFQQPSPNLPSDVAGLSPAIAVSFGVAKWSDFNGDGFYDFVISGRLPLTSSDTAPIYSDVFRNTVTGPPENRTYNFFLVRGIESLWLSDAEWGDIDRDGDLDLVMLGASSISSPYQPQSAVYKSDGNGMTRVESELPGLFSGAVRMGDYDNDGDPDIAVMGVDRTNLHVTAVYRNEGESFTRVQADLEQLAYGELEWLDFDMDSDLDLLVSGVTIDGELLTRVYRNDGGLLVDSGIRLPGLSFARLAIGDFDSDSDPDILLSGMRHTAKFGSGTTVLYRNEQGVFAEVTGDLPDVYYGDIDWFDYNLDGRLDVLLSGRLETFGGHVSQACIQETVARFACSQILTSGLGASPIPGLAYGSISFVDYDLDHDLDLMVTGRTRLAVTTTQLLKNVGFARNSPPLPPSDLTSVTRADSVILEWGPAIDPNTPSSGLTYELRVGTTPGGSEVVSPRSDPVTGFRRVVDFGQEGSGTESFLRGLSPGTYYWSVQAIDNSYEGSPFAAEQTFVIGE